MSEPWTTFAGNALYLDTTTLYVFLRGIGPSVHSLFSRIRAADIRAYTSVLTFDELAYRGLLGLIRDHFEGSPLELLRQHEVEMISRFYPQLAPFLDRLRTFPNLVLVNVSPSDLDIMDEAMRRYHPRPRDSLHLAAMRKCGCQHLVSNDADFDRVPDIRRYTLPQ